MEAEHHLVLNNNSYLSIGIVVLVILATLWIKDGQSETKAANFNTASELTHYKELQAKNFEVLSAKLDTLAVTVQAGTKDRFTGKDAKIFAERLQELNPALKVPKMDEKEDK